MMEKTQTRRNAAIVIGFARSAASTVTRGSSNGSKDRHANWSLRTVDYVYRQLAYKWEPGVAPLDGDAGGAWSSLWLSVETPEQERYTALLTVHYQDNLREGLESGTLDGYGAQMGLGGAVKIFWDVQEQHSTYVTTIAREAQVAGLERSGAAAPSGPQLQQLQRSRGTDAVIARPGGLALSGAGAAGHRGVRESVSPIRQIGSPRRQKNHAQSDA